MSRRIRIFIGLTLILICLAGCNLQTRYNSMERLYVQLETSTATIPPTTPLATLTPSQTLRPPPTFEAPTHTAQPSMTPSATASPTLDLSVDIPGLRGAESPTPSTTPGCEEREEWTLIYTVQANDALAKIAQMYNTTIQELAAANCLSNPDIIRVGQELRVPGGAHPVQPEVECVPFELMTPMNGTLAVAGEGTITFNWRGPRAPRNLIRIHTPSGGTVEFVIELRQNETVNLYEDLHEAGTYMWYVYPLDSNFVQTCPEGGPWTFTKAASPTATPTPTDIEEQEPQPAQPPQVIVVTATRRPRPTEMASDESTDKEGSGRNP
jgi:LysM repeat protein